ncbi:hypothetical protein AAF712_009018 [Marasmius tenuissimus]|uniref:Uncharacterized protein n=1 Tax=Marasmius tenuissimus TaxID=585030 RepID=A0ABR2ZQU2_9AGAR
MGGIATENSRMFRKLRGEDTLKKLVIMASGWEEVRPDVDERRERELMMDESCFKPVLDVGAQMARHNDTPQTARAVLLSRFINVDLYKELAELTKKHGQQREELQKENEGAITARGAKAGKPRNLPKADGSRVVQG